MGLASSIEARGTDLRVDGTESEISLRSTHEVPISVHLRNLTRNINKKHDNAQDNVRADENKYLQTDSATRKINKIRPEQTNYARRKIEFYKNDESNKTTQFKGESNVYIDKIAKDTENKRISESSNKTLAEIIKENSRNTPKPRSSPLIDSKKKLSSNLSINVNPPVYVPQHAEEESSVNNKLSFNSTLSANISNESSEELDFTSSIKAPSNTMQKAQIYENLSNYQQNSKNSSQIMNSAEYNSSQLQLASNLSLVQVNDSKLKTISPIDESNEEENKDDNFDTDYTKNHNRNSYSINSPPIHKATKTSSLETSEVEHGSAPKANASKYQTSSLKYPDICQINSKRNPYRTNSDECKKKNTMTQENNSSKYCISNMDIVCIPPNPRLEIINSLLLTYDKQFVTCDRCKQCPYRDNTPESSGTLKSQKSYVYRGRELKYQKSKQYPKLIDELKQTIATRNNEDSLSESCNSIRHNLMYSDEEYLDDSYYLCACPECCVRMKQVKPKLNPNVERLKELLMPDLEEPSNISSKNKNSICYLSPRLSKYQYSDMAHDLLESSKSEISHKRNSENQLSAAGTPVRDPNKRNGRPKHHVQPPVPKIDFLSDNEQRKDSYRNNIYAYNCTANNRKFTWVLNVDKTWRKVYLV